MAAPAEVLKIATPFVKQFEGFVPVPTDDGTGVPTVGYGMIASDFPPGRMPQHLTEPQAAALLSKKLGGVYYEPVAGLIRGGLKLNPNQQAALLSFIFNLGTGIVDPSHDIGRLLRAHDFNAAADAMLEYSMPGTNVHEGLLRRRKAERALFLKRWVPPDPNHYGWLDDVDRDVGNGRRANERQTAREYDVKRRHWLRYPLRLRRLRQNCAWFAARLDNELAEDHKVDPEGKNFHRAWRRNQLRARSKGRRVV